MESSGVSQPKAITLTEQVIVMQNTNLDMLHTQIERLDNLIVRTIGYSGEPSADKLIAEPEPKGEPNETMARISNRLGTEKMLLQRLIKICVELERLG